MPSPPRSRSGYLPSLDGWRAIAILGVIAVHDVTVYVGHTSLQTAQNYGGLGVPLFFAISGILICSRILEEEALTGRFHLKKFYIRRFFRIQPAALVYLAVIGILTLCGVLHEHLKYWLGALLLYANFLFRPDTTTGMQSFFTGHFWTLAVEEHFYLIISLALFFIKKRRLTIFLIAYILVKIAYKIGIAHTPDPLVRRTYWQIKLLLLPSLVALMLREPKIREAAERWLWPGWVFLATAVACAYEGRHDRQLIVNVLLYAFTFWVVSTMLHPRSWTTRVLEWSPLRFIGRISYSIYLWHVLFFSVKIGPPVSSHLLLVLSQRPWKFICSLAVAIASYYLIEKPFVRMGHRLAPPATAGHKDLTDLPGLVESSHAAGEPA